MAFPNYPKAENWGVREGKASSREGTRIDSLVLHAMAGSYEGSMRWANDSTDNSFHYGLSQDGRVGQAVDEQWAAWQAGNWDMNKRSVGIEHEDKQQAIVSPSWMTPKMFDESTRLAAYLCKKYGIPVSRIYLHKQVTLTGTACPGNFFPLDAYKNRVQELLNGSVSPPKPIGGGTPLAYPEMSRYAFSVAPVVKLDKGLSITYGGSPIGIFYPSKDGGGLPRMSRYKFSKSKVGVNLQDKVALTYAGEVFGIFNPNVRGNIIVPPKQDKVLAPVPPASTRRWHARTLKVAQEIEGRFPVKCSTYMNHGTTGEPWGIDIWVSPLGTRANKEQEAWGDKIYEWVLANWSRLNPLYMIWWDWYIDDVTQFAYSQNVKWPHGSPNINDYKHLNHVHIQIR